MLGVVVGRVVVGGWGLDCRLVELADGGAELVGVGVVEFVEDAQSVLPGGSGGVGIGGGVVCVAEMGEGGGFGVAVAEVAAQVNGVPVAGDGFVSAAEAAVGVAETVPGGGLPVAVADLLEQGEGPARSR